MEKRKHLRLRSLAAFLVPVAFAVFMMQPTPLHQALPLSQQPDIQLIGSSLPSYAPAVSPDLAALLETRWCVRSSDPVTPQDGDILLRYENDTLLLRSDRQYLLSNSETGYTRQIIGSSLYEDIWILWTQSDDADLPRELMRALAQEAQA